MITGKNIIITGCNNGIGLEILKILIRGNNFIICVDTGTDNLQKINYSKLKILQKDVSSENAVDEIFSAAEQIFGKTDIFFANAGFGYYEEINYESWDRIKRIFETNVFSPIYSYQKYIRHLKGENGIFVVTDSVIGLLAIPGYALYSSTKYALSGFTRAIRFECPENLQLTCIYPVATDTGFFRRANKIDFRKPFPVQSPEYVAKKVIEGTEKGKKNINPCLLFNISKPILRIIPPLKALYLMYENRKFTAFKKRVRLLNGTEKSG